MSNSSRGCVARTVPTVALGLYTFVLDFRYVTSFRTQGDSKSTEVESRGQISDFLIPSPVKLDEESLKCLSEFRVLA